MVEVKPHVYKGLPEKNGPKVASVNTVMELFQSPKFTEILGEMEKHQNDGKPMAVRHLHRKQLSPYDRVANMHARENKKVIDEAIKKHRGEYDISAEEAARRANLQRLNNNPDMEPVEQKIYSYNGQRFKREVKK